VSLAKISLHNSFRLQVCSSNVIFLSLVIIPSSLLIEIFWYFRIRCLHIPYAALFLLLFATKINVIKSLINLNKEYGVLRPDILTLMSNSTLKNAIPSFVVARGKMFLNVTATKSMLNIFHLDSTHMSYLSAEHKKSVVVEEESIILFPFIILKKKGFANKYLKLNEENGLD